MFLLTLIFYAAVIFIVFSVPHLRTNRDKSKFILYGLPAFAGLLLAGLTVLKVFFLYKLMILVFGFILGLLTLQQIKHMFKGK